MTRLTPEQDAYVAEHWDRGWPALAAELGISRATVYTARRRALALAAGPPTEVEAISRCVDALETLEPDACLRVLAYLTDRYDRRLSVAEEKSK
jgi:hypothetical protein